MRRSHEVVGRWIGATAIGAAVLIAIPQALAEPPPPTPTTPTTSTTSTSTTSSSETTSSTGATTTTTTTTVTTERPVGSGLVRPVTDGSFFEKVLASPIPALVAFQKPTCVDCATFDSTLQDLASQREVEVFTLDAEQNPATPETYGIITPPCPDCGTWISPLLVLFEDGQVVKKMKIKKPDRSLISLFDLRAQLA